MRSWLGLALLAAGLCAPGWAAAQEEKQAAGKKLPPQAEKKAPVQDNSPAGQLRAIQQDFNAKQQEFIKAYQAAKSQEAKQEVLQTKQPKIGPFLERAIKLAEANANTPAAVDALLWAVQMGSRDPEGQHAEKAQELLGKWIAKAPLSEIDARLARVRLFGAAKLAQTVYARAEKDLEAKEAARLLVWVHQTTQYPPSPLHEKAGKLLMEKFIDNDAVAAVVQNSGRSEGGIESLRDVLKRSKNRKVQAAAHYGLAMALKEREDTAKEAEEHLDKIINEYASDAGTVATQARSELREIRLLGVGKTIPEVEGEDLEGKKFKISDYRGKVVLLDFWGFW